MRIRILARHVSNFSTRRFREEAKKLDVKLSVSDPTEFEIVLGRRSPMLFRNGKKYQIDGAVTPRLGASVSSYGLAVLTQFEMMGVPVVNGSIAIMRTRDKLRCIQLMSKYDIDIPRTMVVRRPSDISATVDMIGGFPIVMKLLSGTQGIGVILAESMQAIEATLDTLWSLGQDILLQECIKESVGRDVRVIVIGGRIVAAMRRQARIGEFRANIHRGGVGTAVKLTSDYERAARRAAKIVGLEIAGVDLLESNEGPKVIEVNSSPGLEGIEAATGVNVAREIIDHIAQVASGKSSVQQVW